MRLNRQNLVIYRRQLRLKEDQRRLLTRHKELIKVLRQLSLQQARLAEEQQHLLREQHELLQLLARRQKRD